MSICAKRRLKCGVEGKLYCRCGTERVSLITETDYFHLYNYGILRTSFSVFWLSHKFMTLSRFFLTIILEIVFYNQVKIKIFILFKCEISWPNFRSQVRGYSTCSYSHFRFNLTVLLLQISNVPYI